MQAVELHILSLYLKAVTSEQICNMGRVGNVGKLVLLFSELYVSCCEKELWSSEQFVNISHDIWASFLVVKTPILHVLANPPDSFKLLI